VHRLFFVFILCFPVATLAHKSSDAFLDISITESMASFQLEVAVRDLLLAVPLDTDDNRNVTWGEVEESSTAINKYIVDHLQIINGLKPCSLYSSELNINQHSDGYYLAARYNAICHAYDDLSVRYTLFFDQDRDHRALVRLLGENQITSIISPLQPTWILPHKESSWDATNRVLIQGIWHIWMGYDHVLFLFSLVLGSLLTYESIETERQSRSRRCIKDIVVVVSVFTLAHSVSLMVVMLGQFRLPMEWVEWTIALTVLLVSLNNLFSIIKKQYWQLTFIFGLVHGMGFANVLSEMNLQHSALFRTLISFNIGVELGQLMILLSLLPVILFFQSTKRASKPLLQIGSLVIVIVASLWTLERFPLV